MTVDKGPSSTEKSSRLVERTLDILECFSPTENELSLVRIAEISGLSISTVSRIMKSLENRHFVVRSTVTKKFALGPRMAQLGSICFTVSNSILRERGYQHLVELKDRTQETASLFVRDDDCRVCIDRVNSNRILRRVINVGDRLPMSGGAPGRLLLSFLSDEEQKRILGDEYEVIKPFLDTIRANDYAVSNGEREEGLSAIAAPIRNVNNVVVGCVSLSGPSVRFLNHSLSHKIDSVQECARQISYDMGYNEDWKSDQTRIHLSGGNLKDQY